MKRNLIAFSDVENNRLNPLSQTDFKRILRDFGQGTKLTVTIEHYRRVRSLGQNNLFHWYVDIIAKDIGEDRDALKHELKSRYGIWEERLDRDGIPIVDEDTGEIMMKLKSTAEYSTEEKSALIDGTIRMAERFGIPLPDPESARNNNLKQ